MEIIIAARATKSRMFRSHFPRIAFSMVAHHLGAACDDDIFKASDDLCGRKTNGGDATAAIAIQRHTARLQIISSPQRRKATEITRLLATLLARRPNDVIHRRCILRVAIAEGTQHRGAQVLRVKMGKCPLPLLTDATWRSAGVNDEGVRHQFGPSMGSARRHADGAIQTNALSVEIAVAHEFHGKAAKFLRLA